MKKLILPLIILTILASAQAQEVPEISDTKIKSDFLTIVKDVGVEDQLSKTAEFNDCRKENEYKPDDTPTQKEEKLRKATECFKKKLPNDPAALKKLSENLQLENYGLVKSKNVSEITEYLSKKMIKSLTGKDPDKITKESLAWKNQKIVDQKVFIDLYKNQLIKSALFEVSRYCFENLRITANSASTDFSTHWSAIINGYNPNNDKPDVNIIDDLGVPSFFKLDPNTDATKNDQVYKDLVTGLSGGQQISAELYEKFFTYCQKSLPLLCEKFRSKVTSQTKNANGEDLSVANSSASSMTNGANSCLTMDKLRSIRKAMANTDLVAKQFDEMGADKNKFALQMLENPKIYQRGKGAGEESLDELTSFSSSDMLEGSNQQEDLAQLEKDCEVGKGGSDCEKFLAVGNQLENAISNVETEMNLKREIEIARVRELKNQNKIKELDAYLEENGMFDILEKKKNDPNFDIETEIGNIYDARKVAEIEALKLKVGKRQISEKDSDTKSDTDKNKMIAENIKDTKEERARLAQVVMFNNIITSQLNLSKKVGDKYESVGRNTSGWTKEAKGLKASGMDESLFSGIQEIADKEGIKTDDTNIAGGGIIDMILGNKDAENAN